MGRTDRPRGRPVVGNVQPATRTPSPGGASYVRYARACRCVSILYHFAGVCVKAVVVHDLDVLLIYNTLL